MTCGRIGMGLAILGVLAMATPLASAGSGAASLEGEWGGDRLQLVIDATGGRVEADCAGGTISGPIVPDRDGKFVAAGTFEQYQAGPQRADQQAKPATARYSGDVKDGQMKLTISPAGAAAEQVFNLRKGVRVKLVRCR